MFIGKAREKTPVIRTERRRNEQTGATYPWIFLKFCTYLPYNAKLCLNGHEYVKQQLAHRGVSYEALDNGILSCANPKRVQAICDALSAEKIDRLLRKCATRSPSAEPPHLVAHLFSRVFECALVARGYIADSAPDQK